MTVVESVVYAIWWYAILTLGALLVFPIVFAACRGLCDRGLSLARPAGVVLAILPVWWIGNITPLPFNTLTIVGCALILGAISWGVVARQIEILKHLRTYWLRLSVIEFASFALFSGYLVLRGFNPALRGTEKPMELAFLNSAIKSDSLPLSDPWFAGEPINYYYFGYAVFGALGKLADVPGEIAFNLALATTFAMAIVAAGGLAANLIERVPTSPGWATGVGGALASFLLMFSGNLHAAQRFWDAPMETTRAGWWDGIGWESSRVIQDAGFNIQGERTVITEFPAFSWILGDLHPHVLAYPWLIATIALAAALTFVLPTRSTLPATVFYSVPVGIGIGVLYTSNTWDVPMAVFIAVLALLVVGCRAGWAVSIVSFISMVLSALLTAVPFAVNYTAAAGNAGQASSPGTEFPIGGPLASMIGIVNWEHTTFEELLTVHGVFLFLMIFVIAGALAKSGIWSWTAVLVFLIASASLSVATIALWASAVILMGIPILFLLLAIQQDRHREPARTLLYLMVIAALLVVIAVEFFFIQDPFGDRMNTVFKMYFQVWAILAIAVGALIPLSIAALWRWAHPAWAGIAAVVVIGILGASSIYAPVSAYHWNDEFSEWQGLFGLSYLEEINQHEAAAIEWLRENTDEDSVIVEAPGCSYGADNGIPHNRMSMGTGVPTIIGWEGHQFQWRRQQTRLLAEIEERQEMVSTIFEEPLGADAPGYLDDYGVTHIVVGAHETLGYERCNVGPPYAEEGLEDLDQTMWQPVFQSGPMMILGPTPEGFVAN